jgi:GNAT superfamily N-acetyltransferase
MSLPTLVHIAPDEYARRVLPKTYGLWGAGRTYDRYVADFHTAVASYYARKHRHTIGIYDGHELVASCKRYTRELRWGTRTLRGVGIGAVFTDPSVRGRGFSTALLGAVLDEELAAGSDVAYLFSNIKPAFYERIGFSAVPSRAVTVRATSLDGSRSGAAPIEQRDWAAVTRTFEALDGRRAWSLRRTPSVWNWIRAKWEAPGTAASGQPINLVVRERRGVRAYVFGRRVVPRDTFFVDEYGYAGDDAATLASAVIRAGAGDLRKVHGWLPPEPARDALPHGSVRPRADALFMVAPLSPAAKSWWKVNGPEAVASPGDSVWPADAV